ncbi:MAG: CsgG/HfaB family protein, partial [Sulfurimicrobium sp.]|nr:CsgG/HfaB family protein [Sulfurimicrobium sp.]
MAQAPKAERPRIAVMPFEGGQGAEQAEAGTALQAMVITDLANVPGLRLLERGRLKDVMAEQELGLSGAVDPATIARVGKLLGATHLLVGRCTVVGVRMRLDTRLLRADTAEVIVAAAIEGEKEAFFELEKDLVNRLIAAMGVKLLPKERAEVAKVHTADYEAFRTFGRGLRLYDAKQVEPALAALRQATARDKDFRLAALTLDEYQRILVQLRTQADDLLLAQGNLEQAKMSEAAAKEAGLVERLQKLAQSKDRDDRLTALHSLAVMFGNVGSRKNKLGNLRKLEDRFAFERQADAAAARYVAGALEAFPAAPLTVEESNFGLTLPENLDDFAKEWAWAKKRLLSIDDNEENRRNKLFASTRDVRSTASMLHLDHRQTVTFQQRIFDQSLGLKPTDYHIETGKEELAKHWRGLLELDRSTTLYTELSRGSDNPWRLKALASEIETNRDLAQYLATSPLFELVREYLLLSTDDALLRAKSIFGTDRDPSLKAFQELTRKREWPRDQALWVGDQPCWSLNAEFFLSTGKRSDRLRTEEIRVWHKPGRESDPQPLVILGGLPRGAFAASFALDFVPPTDFQPRDANLLAGAPRPEATFLFALRDIDCDLVEDPASKKSLLARPMTGLALTFSDKGLRLSAITETVRDQW